MTNIRAPDLQPWEPKLETAPVFNAFMNPTNPAKSLDEEEAEARRAAGVEVPDDVDAPGDEPAPAATESPPAETDHKSP